MRRPKRVSRLAWLFAGGLLVVPTAARAAETKITLKDVPPAVAKAEKDKWPKAQIHGIEREEEDNKTIFEFGLTEGTRKWDASFSDAGALIAVEETIVEKEVPAAVKKGLEKKYPGAKIVLIEKVTEGEKSPKTFYEYKIKTATGGVEVKLDSKGAILTEEQKKAEELNE
jgi:Putative beta-lactamase-inhibitor-like, PepSY-like